jgi:hypothetical protein
LETNHASDLVSIVFVCFAMVLPLCGIVFGLCAFGFWIWMLVDVLKNERLQGNDKVVWVLVVVLLNWLGAAIYYFVERPKKHAV